MKKKFLFLMAAMASTLIGKAQCAPDITNPNAQCQNITVYLDATGNVNVPATAVDNGSTDFCGLAGVYFVKLPKLVMTGVQSDEIWTADSDGSNMQLLYSNVGTGGAGPVGIEYEPTNEMIYVPGGNTWEIFTADAFGGGINGTLANASGMCCEHHDVEIDAANNRIFFTTSGGGVWTGNLDGTGSAVNIYLGSTTTGVEYDAVNNKVFVADMASDEILSMNPDGTGVTVLYNVTDGVSGARQLSIDPAQNKIWWANRETDEIMTGSMDGIAPATVQWSGQAGLYGTHHDPATDLLYWVTFGAIDEVHVANGDGTGIVSTIISGNYGSFRDVSIAGSSTPFASLDFNCSNVGDNDVIFVAVDNAGNADTCFATITVLDTISPAVTCNPGTIYLDENGNATANPDRIYVSDVFSNEIYMLNNDGTNPVLLTSNATSSSQGPIGMDYYNGNLYYGTGNNSSVATISTSGSASGTSLANAGPNSTNYHDVKIDVTNNRIFYTVSFDGLYWTNLDGTGSESLVVSASGAIVGVDYDPIADKVYYVDNQVSEIYSVNPDGTSNTLLYDAADGLSGPRQIAIDAANNRFFVSNFSAGEIVTGSLDGLTPLTTLYSGQSNCFGIDYDSNADLIYWTSTATGEVSSGASNGSGTPNVIASGFGGVRGVLVADNSGPNVLNAGSSDMCGELTYSTSPATFTCTDAGNTVNVTLTATDASGNSSNCMTTVTVLDTLGPNIECLSNITTTTNNAGCTAIVNWTPPVIMDNCGGAILSSSSHSPGDVFSLGTTTVLYTAIDGSGNQTSCTFDVIVTADLSASGIESNASCFGDGMAGVDLTVTGGTSPYTFDWDNDGTGDFDDTEDLIGISGGTYMVVINDDNDCSFGPITFVVTEPSEVMITLDSLVDPSCGAADGAINVSVSGGTPAYLFDWDNDGTGDTDDTEDLAGLGVGAYILNVMDADGCIQADTFDLVNPGAATLSEVHIDASCFGASDGSIDLTVTGGTAPYLFDWDNDGTGDTDDTEDLTGLTAGTYMVSVTDLGLCVSLLTVTVGEASSLNLTFSSVDEVAGNDGSIDLAVTGGTAPYTFDWDNDGTGDNDDTEDLSSLAAGTYIVNVIDANGCSALLTVVIDNLSSIGNPLSSGISIYPNPSKGDVVVNYAGLIEGTKLSVLTLDGKLLTTQLMTSEKMTLDFNHFERGTYLIEVSNEKGSFVKRIVLQ